MKLKVLLPTQVLLEEETEKIIAEAENGSFCLLPRHIDFAAALVPGILSYHRPGGEEAVLAVDEGILIKCGPEVLVSTRNAVSGPDLGQLRETVEKRFKALDERERQARAALAHLEATFIRRFLRMGGYVRQ
ncbi:MAG: F0F1 ATP synthase subunit epsilon [Deltaproteobacteria bacterium]|nr:MAG: F0F1 ATP synthase subunit epsilon [Deltaproteobacteria bacterium]